MLDRIGLDYRYREYRDEPLSVAELKATLALLGLEPHELLRPRESSEAGIGAEMGPERLLEAMAAQPTLIQRPILTNGRRAVLARPAEEILGFLGPTLD